MVISAGIGAVMANQMAPHETIGEIATDVVGSFAGTVVELVDDLVCGMTRAMTDIGEQWRHKIENCE